MKSSLAVQSSVSQATLSPLLSPVEKFLQTYPLSEDDYRLIEEMVKGMPWYHSKPENRGKENAQVIVGIRNFIAGQMLNFRYRPLLLKAQKYTNNLLARAKRDVSKYSLDSLMQKLLESAYDTRSQSLGKDNLSELIQKNCAKKYAEFVESILPKPMNKVVTAHLHNQVSHTLQEVLPELSRQMLQQLDAILQEYESFISLHQEHEIGPLSPADKKMYLEMVLDVYRPKFFSEEFVLEKDSGSKKHLKTKELLWKDLMQHIFVALRK